MSRYSSKTASICLIGVTAAILIIMAQISIPLPFGVPMTMQSFAVMLAAILLGRRNGTLCVCIYLLLGAAGLPVFSNFSGGFSRLIGPTGGFLWSFPCMSFIIGLGNQYRSKHKAVFVFSLILGNAVNLLCGTLFYAFIQHVSFMTAVTVCITPFLLPTIIKIFLAATLGINLQKRLSSCL